MKSEFFEYKLEKKIGYLNLNRPDIHNAFNDEMITDLTKLFQSFSASSGERLVVVRGNGKSFCAGADLNWMKAMKNYSEAENREDSKALQLMFETINRCVVPTLGVVHGAALGGGSGLVSCFDYVIAESETRFGFSEAKLGLLPAVISPYVVAKIGQTYARAYFTTGERFSALDAMKMGLVHNVVTNSDLEERVLKVIKQFSTSGPEASKFAKDLAFEVSESSDHEKCAEYTRNFIAKVRIGDEAQEGMNAMLEKRKPNWVSE